MYFSAYDGIIKEFHKIKIFHQRRNNHPSDIKT